MSPELTTHPLVRADGSATLTTNLFTILAAVNGPVEVSRRDELPEEAAIEVNIRPSAGVGGPRERWLETQITSLLRSVLLVHMHPRTLIQVTLQIVKEPVGVKIRRREMDVAVIPDLANAAFLALVDSGLPLQRTVVGVLGVLREGVVVGPSEKQILGCKSLHAMVFNEEGEMLLDESAGVFTLEQWSAVYNELKEAAVAAVATGDKDDAMANGNAGDSTPWLRKVLEERVRSADAWREDG